MQMTQWARLVCCAPPTQHHSHAQGKIQDFIVFITVEKRKYINMYDN